MVEGNLLLGGHGLDGADIRRALYRAASKALGQD
jgi:hypothetical protein